MGVIIYKYKITHQFGSQEIQMPFGAKAISAQVQDNQVCIWALADPDARLETRTVELVGTGIFILDAERFLGLNYFIGTCQILNGSIVLHVFISK